MTTIPVRTRRDRGTGAPDLANIDNEPDKLVTSGRLTVPLLHIWNHGDRNTCGALAVSCPLRDGSSDDGITDCIHEPLAPAIAAQARRAARGTFRCASTTMRSRTARCTWSRTRSGSRTPTRQPADYIAAAMAWIDARLAES